MMLNSIIFCSWKFASHIFHLDPVPSFLAKPILLGLSVPLICEVKDALS